MAEVERVLAEIGAADVPQILVYNKQDLLPEDQRPRQVDRLPCCGAIGRRPAHAACVRQRASSGERPGRAAHADRSCRSGRLNAAATPP